MKDTLALPWRRSRASGWPLAVAAALYTALGLVYLRPVWRVWQDRIAPNTGDPLFVLWVLKWGVHQIRLGLPDLWNANIFHPTREHPGALGPHARAGALQLFLFDKAVPNAIAGYNFLLFTSFVLTGLAVCWVIRRSGASWTAADSGRRPCTPSRHSGWGSSTTSRSCLRSGCRSLSGSGTTCWRSGGSATPSSSFSSTCSTSPAASYLAYMIHIPLLVILINRAAIHGRELVNHRSLRVLIPTGLAAGAALAAVFLPYLRIGRGSGLARDADEVGLYGATLLAGSARPATPSGSVRSPRRSCRSSSGRPPSRSSARKTPCSRASSPRSSPDWASGSS